MLREVTNKDILKQAKEKKSSLKFLCTIWKTIINLTFLNAKLFKDGNFFSVHFPQIYFLYNQNRYLRIEEINLKIFVHNSSTMFLQLLANRNSFMIFGLYGSSHPVENFFANWNICSHDFFIWISIISWQLYPGY